MCSVSSVPYLNSHISTATTCLQRCVGDNLCFSNAATQKKKSIFVFSLLLVHPFIHRLDCFALPFCKTEKLFFSEILPDLSPSHLSRKSMAFFEFFELAGEIQNPPSACQVVMSSTSNYVHIPLRSQNITKMAVLMDAIAKKDMTKS